MKILYINHYAGSPRRGMEFRPWYLAREWEKIGHEVTVIAADYSHLRRDNPSIQHYFDKTSEDGVQYIWVKTPHYSGNGLRRAVNMAVFCFKLRHRAKSLAREYKPDAVIASSTYPFDIYPAARIARMSGGRLFFEIHDLWPLTQIELYHLKTTNPYVRLLQRAEDYAFRQSERVISILPDAWRHLEERGVTKNKFVYIPNGVVPGSGTQTSPHDKTIAKLRAKGRFIVMYAGGFAEANALDDIVKAAELMDDNTAIVLVGDGPKKAGLIEKSRSMGEKAPVFLDAVPKTQVEALLMQADCLYLGARRCGLYRYGAGMNKLYDYMLAARPVIFGIEASNDETALAGCGITIEPESPEAIAAAVSALKDMSPEQRAEMGRRGMDYVLREHNYAMLAKKFITAMKG